MANHFERRHYRKIADVIKATREDGGDISALTNRLMSLFKSDNHNFDRDRFSEACEPSNHKGEKCTFSTQKEI